MMRLIKSLFGKSVDDGPQVANTIDVNQVLTRSRPAPPALRAAKAPPGRPKLPARPNGEVRESMPDFGADELSMEQPKDNGFNPYDTGRSSAAELWDKRHRDGVD